MLEQISIRNFQSLKEIDLELGKFTVIVGESSNGKSAVVRALRAVASNKLDSDYITQGSKHSSVTVKTDSGTVTIERTVGGSSAYKVTEISGKESSHTSINRKVPSEVTQILGIEKDTKEVVSINFAGQHDTPYLLKDGASTVATVLGELTNVSTIFEAVKEASRRSKNANSLLNLRKKDLDKVLIQIATYANLPQQSKAIASAELLYTQVQELNEKIILLQRLINTAQTASEALQSIKQIPELPDVAPLLKAQHNLSRFTQLLRSYQTTSKDVDTYVTSVSTAQSAILQLEEKLHQNLVSYGHCPLCKQSVKEEL